MERKYSVSTFTSPTDRGPSETGRLLFFKIEFSNIGIYKVKNTNDIKPKSFESLKVAF